MQELKPTSRISPWIKKIWPVVLIGALCVAAYLLGASGANRPKPNAGLMVDSSKVNFGTVWENNRFHWSLPITNPTDEQIEIIGFDSTCGCVSVEPSVLVLPPNQTKEMELTLDLTANRTGNSKWSFAVRIFPQINGLANQQSGWTIRGQVKKAFTIDPDYVHFGEFLPQHASSIKKIIRLRAYVDSDDLAIKCHPPVISARVHKLEGKSREFQIEIVPLQTLNPGSITSKISIQALTKQGEIPAFGYLRVDGLVAHALRLSPAALHFGAQPLGRSFEETVTVASVNGATFKVKEITPASADIKVKPIPKGIIRLPTFRVNQKVTRLGSTQSKVVFTAEVDGQIEDVTISLPVTYHGIPNGQFNKE